MTEKTNGTILWLSPPDMPPAVNAMNAWLNYFSELENLNVTTDKNDDYDIVFFGSDSLLDKELLEDDSAFKICYFWGWPYWRLVDPSWLSNYRGKLELLRKCNVVLAGAVVTLYQLYDFGIQNSLCYAGVDSRMIDSVPLQEKEFQVCTCGRLVIYKEFDVLIKAVALLKQKPKVVIIGKGPEEQNLKALANKLEVNLKIENAADFEKIKEYKKSVCFIAPYRYAGFTMVSFEALYAGTPVIAYDMPLNREFLKGNAIYFADVQDLASKLDHVLNKAPKDISLRSSIFRDYIANNFTFEKASERLNLVFQEAMKIQKQKTNPHWERHWRASYILPELRGNVLDAGCGIGINAIRMAEEGHDVRAIDKNERHVAAATRLAKAYGLDKEIKVMHADLFKLPFDDDEFTSTHIGEVIEHFELRDLTPLMHEVIRVTKDRIVGTTPIGYNHFDPDHKTIWSESTLKEFLESLADVRLVKLKEIAERGKPASCFLFVLRKAQLRKKR